MTKTDGACVIWPGAKDRQGYGLVKINGRCQRAHRVALAKKVGRELSRSELALHSCHTPSCVNPQHLRVGSAAQNNREARARQVTLAKSVLGIGFVVE